MFRTVLQSAALVFFGTFSAAAQELAAPKGEVLLRVSGKLTASNTAGGAELDLEMLQQIGAKELETSTIWTDGTQVFEGVPLHALVAALGLQGTTLRATAINDYSVDIPMSDATEGGPIVAYKLNGVEMSVRDKGPLWIVYPFDASADYRTEVIYARSIWQLNRIKAVE